MTRLLFRELSIDLKPRETALEALERQGVKVPSSCRVGACQACLMRVVSGEIPASAQKGLKPSLQAAGFVLACQLVPSFDMELTLADDLSLGSPADIVASEPLNHDVVRVRLRPTRLLAYRPGQFVTLLRDDGLARSYSLASVAHEPDLELHVRIHARGQMSRWLSTPACVGARLELRGPSGSCFYVPQDKDDTLLLVGTGTGLAPLWGIARDALAQGHRGTLHVLHGAVSEEGLYFRAELAALAQAHSNVRVHASVLRGVSGPALHVGAIDELLLTRFPRLQGHRLYVCGDPAMVSSLRRKAFLAGARLSDIAADAFVTAPPPS